MQKPYDATQISDREVARTVAAEAFGAPYGIGTEARAALRLRGGSAASYLNLANVNEHAPLPFYLSGRQFEKWAGGGVQ
jgi:hypothetical protein